MMDLDLRQVRSFMDVADLGSFSAAADKAGLTQPAISLHIRLLEKQLGVRLIERVGRRAQPAAAGRDFLIHARRIAEEVAHAIDTVAPHRSGVTGRLRIGTGATACIYLLPPVLAKIRQAMPGIEIVVQTGNTHDILRLLEANTIDAAVVALPASGRSLDISDIHLDELVAVFPHGAVSDTTVLNAETLSTRPLLLYEGGNTRRLVDQWFSASGRTVQPAMELGSVEAIKKLAGAGLGLAIVPRMAMEHEGAVSELEWRALEPPLERRIALALQTRQAHDRAAAGARGCAAELAETIKPAPVSGAGSISPAPSDGAGSICKPQNSVQSSPFTASAALPREAATGRALEGAATGAAGARAGLAARCICLAVSRNAEVC